MSPLHDVAGELLEQGAAERAHHSANPDHARHSRLREQVRHHREQVGRPPLVGRHGQPRQPHHQPHVLGKRSVEHRQDGHRAYQQGALARHVEAPAALEHGSGKIATAHAADGGHAKSHCHRPPVGLNVQVERLLQIAGQPENVEPPDGIAEELGDGEYPGFLARQQADIGNLVEALARIALDVRQLGSGNRTMVLRLGVHQKPERQPDKAGGSGSDEGAAPSLVAAKRRGEDTYQQRHQQRDRHGADVGAGIKNTGRQRSLAPGKPFRHGLDAGGKVGGFSQPKKEHGDAECQHRTGGAGDMAATLHSTIAIASPLRVPTQSVNQPAPTNAIA